MPSLLLRGADPEMSGAQGLWWGDAAGASGQERRGMESVGRHREQRGGLMLRFTLQRSPL